MVARAVQVFATRSYAGTSIDELVTELGVHRNSLYRVFGSKRGLYLAALRHSLSYDVGPLLESGGPPRPTGPELDLLLLALAEQAPVDREVAALVTETLAELDRGSGGPDATARILGERLRTRVVGPDQI